MTMELDTKQLAKGLVDALPDFPTEEEQNHILSIPLDNMESQKKPAGFFTATAQAESVAKPVPAPPSFWQVEYYKEYFDINTETAIQRIIKAAWPVGPDSFVDTEHKADLYVPLWTFITLIISMSTFGNIVHAVKAAHGKSARRIDVEFDPTKVTTTATILLFYLVINPCIFYTALKCKGANITLAELLCLYGYSYVPFIPMSLLFALQYPIFQVVVLFGAAGISMYFLYRNLGELCQKYLGDLMVYAKPYMIMLQVLFVVLIYFKIYN